MEIDAVADSILESPQGSEYGGDVDTAAAAAGERDVPGPSSTYFPPAEPDPLAAPSSTAGPSGAGPSSSAHPSTSAAGAAGAPPASPTLPSLADADDPDDEVVSALPVYISPALGAHLALFQYPLQHRSLRVPQWAADRGKRITSRVKETVGRVEVEIPVDADTRVWREDRARELGFVPEAVSSNGHREEEGGKKKKEKDARWGDKMRLRSEVVPTKEGTYFSGIVHDGESWRCSGGHV